MKIILTSNLLLSLLFASGLVQAEAKLNAAKDRMTDQAIRADEETYTQTQARIAALNNTGIPVSDYNLSKAQCWLDVSLHEYTRNDRSSFTQESLNQADSILTALEQKTEPNPAAQTPLVNNADKLRDDLWSKIDGLKQAKGLSCYAQKLACAEVELVHAGNEHKQQGWRHAKPYVQIAEDLVAEADATGDRCLPPPAPVVAASPPAPVLPVMETEQINIVADALFKFDKYAGDEMLPAGKASLDELATKLKEGYILIESIKLTGYTDRLGSAEYNLKLSEQRALAVKRYLQSKGVGNVIETKARGEQDVVAACGTSTKPTEALKECLQPNRRVTVEIKGVKNTISSK